MAPSLHLLRRTTYGLSPALLAEGKGLTDKQWVAKQLAWQMISDLVATQVVARMPVLTVGSAKLIADARAANRFGHWDQMMATGEAGIARAIWSRRQLLERMVDVWSNHFNVTCPSDGVGATRASYDLNAIRPNALGTFRALLHAVIHHPAMLIYLNNDSSTRDHPNENLGRELLELHTVGVDAGYSEDDVLNCARILTGLSRAWDTDVFVYRQSEHWTGAVRVLGFRHTNASSDGRPVVAGLLDYLARHKATARRIAALLARTFVADVPPPALVNRLAATYTKHDTAIAPMLTELFASKEFAASADQKVRRPGEQVYAAFRTLGTGPGSTGVDGVEWLYWQLGIMNATPYAWPTPDGYPIESGAWRSAGATQTRINAVTSVAQGWWPKTLAYPPVTKLVPTPRPTTHGALVAGLYQRLHYRAMSSADLRAVCTWLGVSWSTPLTGSSEALGWRLPGLVGVLLNAPALAIY